MTRQAPCLCRWEGDAGHKWIRIEHYGRIARRGPERPGLRGGGPSEMISNGVLINAYDIEHFTDMETFYNWKWKG